MHGGVGRGQAEHGAGGDGLAGAGRPDQGDALAGVDPQVDTVHDRGAADGDGEPADVEDGAHRAAPVRRIARPSTVTAVASTTIASPGKVLIHGAVCR